MDDTYCGERLGHAVDAHGVQMSVQHHGAPRLVAIPHRDNAHPARIGRHRCQLDREPGTRQAFGHELRDRPLARGTLHQTWVDRVERDQLPGEVNDSVGEVCGQHLRTIGTLPGPRSPRRVDTSAAEPTGLAIPAASPARLGRGVFCRLCGPRPAHPDLVYRDVVCDPGLRKRTARDPGQAQTSPSGLSITELAASYH